MLGERRAAILRLIIEYYIKTGEPIGSKTLCNLLPYAVSSATIRNEMADLEMLGYLEHPHTSAGRIPSSKGYRFYVDGLGWEPAFEAEGIIMIRLAPTLVLSLWDEDQFEAEVGPIARGVGRWCPGT